MRGRRGGGRGGSVMACVHFHGVFGNWHLGQRKVQHCMRRGEYGWGDGRLLMIRDTLHYFEPSSLVYVFGSVVITTAQ